jgi:hypothetical protein
MDFIIPISISILFFLAKIIEMKFINREQRPLKDIVKDTFIIFLVSLAVVFLYFNYSHYITSMFHVVTENKLPMIGTPEIFTDKPEF